MSVSSRYFFNVDEGLTSVSGFFPRTFSIRWIWFSAVFTIIGGGQATAGATFFSILADSSSAAERYKLIQYPSESFLFALDYFEILAHDRKEFKYVTNTQIDRPPSFGLVHFCFSQKSPVRVQSYILSVTKVISLGVPISAVLMTRNIWLPSCIAIGIEFIGFGLMFTLPETLQSTESASGSLNHLTEGELSDSSRPKKSYLLQDSWKKLKVMVKDALGDSAFIFQNPELLLLISTFFVHILGRVSLGLILQYTSKKFGWSIAKVS